MPERGATAVAEMEEAPYSMPWWLLDEEESGAERCPHCGESYDICSSNNSSKQLIFNSSNNLVFINSSLHQYTILLFFHHIPLSNSILFLATCNNHINSILILHHILTFIFSSNNSLHLYFLHMPPHLVPSPFIGPYDSPPHPAAPPSDPKLQKRIDKLVEYAAKNGPEFEAMIREKQQDNPNYSFLFGGEGHNYYRSFKGLSGPLPSDVAMEMNNVLNNLTGTKESIKGAKIWFMQRSPFAPTLAEALRDRVFGVDDSERQLHIIYLANDILFDSLQRRMNPYELDNEALAFKPILGLPQLATNHNALQWQLDKQGSVPILTDKDYPDKLVPSIPAMPSSLATQPFLANSVPTGPFTGSIPI
ncbi:hypothetical protein TEA_009460 [Camellia sinensis var. sinensis]|uniref:SURP motif domain-containing protein n=1 Tax=Camellia sinensis var. sinensis TaxID=542762 RepID=A0A4V3WP79_CAMSN|nr:hypothetical protein TEA_009460 [Camellia sinensis var. sinensis]